MVRQCIFMYEIKTLFFTFMLSFSCIILIPFGINPFLGLPISLLSGLIYLKCRRKLMYKIYTQQEIKNLQGSIWA